jgi:hypothetical protein
MNADYQKNFAPLKAVRLELEKALSGEEKDED